MLAGACALLPLQACARPWLRVRTSMTWGMRRDALAELAAARVALLRVPVVAAAAATVQSGAATWPAAWCASAHACAALAQTLQRDTPALAALASAALASDIAPAPSRVPANALLGGLLQASAVRSLFPVPVATVVQGWHSRLSGWLLSTTHSASTRMTTGRFPWLQLLGVWCV